MNIGREQEERMINKKYLLESRYFFITQESEFRTFKANLSL